ncbi:MAG: 50S ribosomal protein L11 methyltransferase [Oculatellaceae cyanobacterium Prado106]|jgi:ribosomal protein L11 methyltransferase|nr:50S ribosomal protein L11 methyltransferase [Oculatellaceae cyanobacterium Prado106]
MSWLAFRLHTTREAIDWVCTLLADAIAPENLQFSPDLLEPWEYALQIFLPEADQTRDRIQHIEQVLSSLQRTGLASDLEITEIDALPLSDLAPQSHRIGQRFVILNSTLNPTMSDVPGDHALIPLQLKTSLAFGSGLHPATNLALQLLERYVKPGMRSLDLGSGSGILAVAMAKLGAQVLAVDNDPIAVQSTQDAVQRNDVESQVTVMEGSLGQGSTLGHWMGGTTAMEVPAIAPEVTFDLIAANILARVHVTLAADFRRSLTVPPQSPTPQSPTPQTTGLLITAGYTTDYEETVEAALTAAGFQRIAEERSQEWVAVAYQVQERCP